MTDQNLPEGWVSTALSDVVLPVSKTDPAKFERAHFKYIDISAVDGDAQLLTEVPTIAVESAPSRARQQVRVGDTIFSTVRPYLRKIAWLPEYLDGEVASTGFCVLRPSPAIDSRFLFFAVTRQDFLNEITAKQRGVSYPAVRPAEILEIPIPLPPLPEQRRIVEALEGHLSRLDAAVELITAAMRRADTLGAAIRSASVSVTQDTKELPSGWVWRTLDDLSVGSSYGTSTKCDSAANGTPVIRIPNIKAGQLDFNDMKYAADSGLDLSNLYLGPGDLLFVRTNGSPALIGRTAVVRGQTEMAFASYLIRFRLGSIELADWVQLVLSTQTWRHQVMKAAASSAGQYNLNQKFLRSLRIPVPLPSERRELLDLSNEGADEMRRLMQVANTVRVRSGFLRRSVLQAAFDGELVDQDPTDEHAGVTLAKLRAKPQAKPSRTGQRQPSDG